MASPTRISIPTSATEQPGTKVVLGADGELTVTSTFELQTTDSVGALRAFVGTRHPRYAEVAFSNGEVVDAEGGITRVVATYGGKVAVGTGGDGTTQNEAGTGTAGETAPVTGTDATVRSGTGTDTDGEAMPVTWKNTTGIDAQFRERELKEVMQAGTVTRTLSMSTSEEPLLSHKKFSTLGGAEKKALAAIISGVEEKDGGGLYQDDVTTATGLKALAYIRDGVTSFLSPRLVWRVGFTKAAIPISSMALLGKIMTPWASPPALADERNWLFEGGEFTANGADFDGSLTWLCSERGGFDSWLYS